MWLRMMAAHAVPMTGERRGIDGVGLEYLGAILLLVASDREWHCVAVVG